MGTQWRNCGRVVVALALTLFTVDQAVAAYRLERVVNGLNQPTYVTQAPGDNLHLYIVERQTPGSPTTNPGRILKHSLVDGSTIPFYQFPTAVTSGDGGVLAMAFHPDFGTNGKFYATSQFLEGGAHRNRVYELFVDEAGLPTLNRIVLEYDNILSAHSVDWIGFNPLAVGDERDYLYITTGDGGRQIQSGSYINYAQNLSSLYGKVLRIDVSSGFDEYPFDPRKNFGIPGDNPYANDGDANTLGEVFASGFRNPFRASFDRSTGDLYIGNVGFQAREEIEFIKAGTSGQDFGWAKREGTIPSSNPTHAGDKGASLDPIYEYAHQVGTTEINGFSVTGGYVYRGAIEGLQGRYFFGDFVTKQVYSVAFDRETDSGSFNGLNMTGLINHAAALNASIVGGGMIDFISSFGEDNAGNLYIVDYGFGDPPPLGIGEIFRIVPDLLDGDFNRDGTVNAADYVVWRDTLGQAVASGALADGNFTGVIDAGDWRVWRDHVGDESLDAGVAVPEPASLALLLTSVMTGVFSVPVQNTIRRVVENV